MRSEKKPKGQRSLKSFFAASLKKNLQEATANHDDEQKKHEKANDRSQEPICIDLSPPDAKGEIATDSLTSPHFGRPAKKPKLDHDYSDLSSDLTREAQPSLQKHLGGTYIPPRRNNIHEKFCVAQCKSQIHQANCCLAQLMTEGNNAVPHGVLPIVDKK